MICMCIMVCRNSCTNTDTKRKYKQNLKYTKMNYYSRLISNSKNKSKTIWIIIYGITNNFKRNVLHSYLNVILILLTKLMKLLILYNELMIHLVF